MTDVAEQVAGTPAPDANVSPDPAPTDTAAVETGNEADSSPAAPPQSEKQHDPIEDMQQRVNKVTRNWRDTERERDYWREQALKAKPAEEPAPPAAPLKIPTLADFEYDENKYQAALLQYTESVAERKAQDVLKAERERQAAEARVTTWKQRAEEFAKSKPDFDDVVSDPSLPFVPAIAQIIQESEIGPELAYHLASNRGVLSEIAGKSATEMALALGKLEGRLLAQKELATAPKQPPPVTKAPPPPPRISASDAPSVSVKPTEADSDKAMSDAEWMRARNKQVKRKGNG